MRLQVKQARRGIILLVMWIVGGAVLSTSGLRIQGDTLAPQRSFEPVPLGSTVYESSRGPRLFTVWRRDVNWNADAIYKYLTTHRDRNSVPNVVLYAVDEALESSTSRTIAWIMYDSLIKPRQPTPVWSADVVMHPLNSQIFVTVAKSAGVDTTLSIFQVARDVSIAPYPLDLQVASVETWPEPAKPITTFELEVKDRQACTVFPIRVTGTPQGILVAALRQPKCATAYAEYDFGARSWRHVSLVPIP